MFTLRESAGNQPQVKTDSLGVPWNFRTVTLKDVFLGQFMFSLHLSYWLELFLLGARAGSAEIFLIQSELILSPRFSLD